MDEITAQAVEELRALPGIDDVGAHVGRAVQSDQIVNVNSGEIWVSVSEAADYDGTRSPRSSGCSPASPTSRTTC